MQLLDQTQEIGPHRKVGFEDPGNGPRGLWPGKGIEQSTQGTGLNQLLHLPSPRPAPTPIMGAVQELNHPFRYYILHSLFKEKSSVQLHSTGKEVL